MISSALCAQCVTRGAALPSWIGRARSTTMRYDRAWARMPSVQLKSRSAGSSAFLPTATTRACCSKSSPSPSRTVRLSFWRLSSALAVRWSYRPSQRTSQARVHPGAFRKSESSRPPGVAALERGTSTSSSAPLRSMRPKQESTRYEGGASANLGGGRHLPPPPPALVSCAAAYLVFGVLDVLTPGGRCSFSVPSSASVSFLLLLLRPINQPSSRMPR
mmetsp:Transcript_13651/g.19500  ORF Transcript_13651/g.19500 Transcript_13651/m.19500 type:complete len:218 (+) Transcript_13651:247-900(+)